MPIPQKLKTLVLATVVGMTPLAATAADSAIDAINAYRELLADGNPSELVAAQGEELWKTPRGPKNATLEQCDLGLGPGVVKGASAQLPRYFKDTGRVQDLETRLMTCLQTLQGVDTKELNKARFGKGLMEEMESLVAYVVTESKGQKIKVDMRHPEMKKMYALGKTAFFYRGGSMDFSCATCHGESGKRIRLQELPDLRTHEGAAAGWGSWPAYRVSNGQFWTMQHRLNDCYRQQRFPEPIYGSDVTIALSVYLAANGNGGTVMTPGIKR
ncbi:MAG: sulfur oxidation c-type cytochrome SoxA [Dechloromonas sp.]|nr:sulfur oxidation c-type cytochrome SoxA [Dechloromonas sp.]